MLKKLMKLARTHLVADKEQLKRDGYLWMCSEQYERKLTGDEMEELLNSCHFEEGDPFDEGAYDAIMLVRSAEENKQRIVDLVLNESLTDA